MASRESPNAAGFPQGEGRSYFQIGHSATGEPYWRVQVQAEDNSPEALERAFTLAVDFADRLGGIDEERRR